MQKGAVIVPDGCHAHDLLGVLCPRKGSSRSDIVQVEGSVEGS